MVCKAQQDCGQLAGPSCAQTWLAHIGWAQNMTRPLSVNLIPNADTPCIVQVIVHPIRGLRCRAAARVDPAGGQSAAWAEPQLPGRQLQACQVCFARVSHTKYLTNKSHALHRSDTPLCSSGCTFSPCSHNAPTIGLLSSAWRPFPACLQGTDGRFAELSPNKPKGTP